MIFFVHKVTMPHPDLLVHSIDSLYTINPSLGDKSVVGLIKDASVGFRDGRVVFIGPSDSSEAEEARGAATQTIDGTGLVGLPGLVDCHTHSVWAGSRADEFARRLAGAKYEDIAKAGGGILSTVENTRKASLEELISNCRGRVANMTRRGVTTVEVKSGYGLTPEAEAKMLRAARAVGEDSSRIVTTFLGAHALPREFRDAMGRKKYVQQVINDQLPLVMQYGLADNVDVFCDSIGFTLDEARDILVAGQRAGLQVKAHAEQIKHTGCTSLVAELGGLSADHLEQVAADDIAAMREKNVVAVCLPGAQMYLHDRPPPVVDFRAAGVKMAVATDLNPGSSPVHDLWTTATLACVLQGMTIEEAVEGITRNAGLAVGRPDVGWLGVDGSVGDLALFRTQPGDPSTIASLIQNIGGHTTELVIRDGKIVHDPNSNKRQRMQ